MTAVPGILFGSRDVAAVSWLLYARPSGLDDDQLRRAIAAGRELGGLLGSDMAGREIGLKRELERRLGG